MSHRIYDGDVIFLLYPRRQSWTFFQCVIGLYRMVRTCIQILLQQQHWLSGFCPVTQYCAYVSIVTHLRYILHFCGIFPFPRRANGLPLLLVCLLEMCLPIPDLADKPCQFYQHKDKKEEDRVMCRIVGVKRSITCSVELCHGCLRVPRNNIATLILKTTSKLLQDNNKCLFFMIFYFTIKILISIFSQQTRSTFYESPQQLHRHSPYCKPFIAMLEFTQYA